ncbi:uncharacterized protein LOC131237465 [Magnolia sinica]|uniref:uncharacterized protein LOC131237465 n=1 Tax=Magnolia sinica TaxID=86752 RepID=UPI00265A6FAA|nr:uncharacterized protein LOC131237465 [Magnolia sinica]
MEKPESGELQCVGRLEIVKPKPVVGFICGTLPVPTDEAFHAALVPSSSTSSSSSQTVKAPRYRMLPTETDLNMPPLPSNFPDKAFPIAAMPVKTSGDLHWESGPIAQNLARKCEALAVSGLAEYGDEIDVVAPTDILKQIFKIPYSKARLSVAVQRIGQTLVLNTGPDLEEGEKLVRRQSNQSKGDHSIFLNFAMHSVRVEACDCPPTQYVPPEESSSTILPGHVESREGSFVSSACPTKGSKSKIFNGSVGGSRKEGFNCCGEYSEGDQESFFWGGKQNRQNNRHDAIKKTSQVGEKARCPVQESEKHRRVGNDGFLRVLFWQFHNFRMLLGSDLLLFSNEKYVAVSLHLWDVTRQVTPLTWLEAWLDNVMASVPELAICYHENGVVQGYELLKTDDIFLLKGISEDGTPAFHPQVVKQNGLSVLRFLQDNCKLDPGAYWLYKSAGEDVIQLFDLSVLPKNRSSDDHDNDCSSLPSLMQRARRDSLFSLGTLLYRLGHRISLSKVPNNMAKCARLFEKCLEFLDEQDHLVVRAYAHEQFARLILKCYEELDLTSEPVLLESEVIVTDVEDESSEFPQEMFGSIIQDKMPSQVAENVPLTEDERILLKSVPEKMAAGANSFPPRNMGTSEGPKLWKIRETMEDPDNSDSLAVCHVSAASSHMVQTVADPISSKLAAIHHVSQAIKSLGWKCQLQNTEGDLMDHGNKTQDKSSHIGFSVCACGDADCIEVCDIREWLARSKMDQKLWKLVLLLGESYLALGQAYKEDGQLHQALKVVELACSVYGSMPQHLEDAQFISSMVSSSPPQLKFRDRSGKRSSVLGGTTERDRNPAEECLTINGFSSNYLFWAKAWALVGDVYVEYHLIRGKEPSVHLERKASVGDWRVSNEVAREVKRLNKKLGQYKQNCSMCSLINCSCQSDRANSGNSASSSSGDVRSLAYGRKQAKKPNVKSNQHSLFGIPESDHVFSKVDDASVSENRCVQTNWNDDGHSHVSEPAVHKREVTYLDANFGGDEGTLEMHGPGLRASVDSEPQIQDVPNTKSGGIFKFLEGPKIGDVEYNLSAAIGCYDAARRAIWGLPIGSTEMQSIVKRKGWACNELGRYRLDDGDLRTAELAFVEAIKAFKEVADHTNIILINCNLGHGRRALAEAMISKMENYKKHGLLQNAYKQALEAAKLEYSESLRYYGAALSELNAMGEGADSVSNNLWNEVKTQFAHTYLKLGMLLAREDISAEVFENRNLEELPIGPTGDRFKKELRKHEISANDAIREALCIYESLGELRKQESAYAYFQLACYHRDCCLKFLDLDDKKIKSSRCESSLLQKVKWYASLAERNWQRSIDFYGPKTHPIMYLTILMERSALFLRLSSSFQLNLMLESALSQLLEGRHVVGEGSSDLFASQHVEIGTKFWGQLQSLLKKMLGIALSGNSNKSSAVTSATPTNRTGDVSKLRELYRLSLISNSLSQLQTMYELWA